LGFSSYSLVFHLIVFVHETDCHSSLFSLASARAPERDPALGAAPAGIEGAPRLVEVENERRVIGLPLRASRSISTPTDRLVSVAVMAIRIVSPIS